VTVRVESTGGVSWLTIDRPEVRNAITDGGMIEDICSAVESAEADPSVNVLVVTGAGTAFSAGGNVKDMAERAGMFAGDPYQVGEGYRTTIQRLTRVFLNTDLVTIAAVNGPAIGAGFDLALACDLRLGSPSARFAHTFVDLGIIPGDGGAWLLPRVVGWQRACELAFTARVIDAETAVEYGVLLSVHADLTRATRALADAVAARPGHSLRLTKRLLRHARTMELDGFLDLTASLQALAHTTEEHRLAVERYLERWSRS
jgi:enoyl-CoA hydratase/carnithine racemase